jgi:hypothetical protein
VSIYAVHLERVVEAFQQLPMSHKQRRAVQALLDNPGLSSEALSNEAGWRGKTWQLVFGTMCREREGLLWPAPSDDPRRRKFRSGILANFNDQTRGFTLKSEAVEAFARFGLRPQGSP